MSKEFGSGPNHGLTYSDPVPDIFNDACRCTFGHPRDAAGIYDARCPDVTYFIEWDDDAELLGLSLTLPVLYQHICRTGKHISMHSAGNSVQNTQPFHVEQDAGCWEPTHAPTLR